MNTNPIRTVSTPHLVFGVLFTGLAALWLIAQATDADIPDAAAGFPAVLIGAGIVGLVATVVNSRRRSRPQVTPYDAEAAAPENESVPEDVPGSEATEPTAVLTDAPENPEQEK